MKKATFTIIAICAVFATELAGAECYFNVPYNGQRVIYCDGNDGWNSYYNGSYFYDGSYHSYSPYSNGYYGNGYRGDFDASFFDGSSYNGTYGSQPSDGSQYSNSTSPIRTREENYYNLLNLNGIPLPQSEQYTGNDTTLEDIVGETPQYEKIEDITLTRYAFANKGVMKKYQASSDYVYQVKSRAKSLFKEGVISADKMNDIVNTLDFLVYNMNVQFKNLKLYEQTSDTVYRESALEATEVVKTSYNRLKFLLGGN